MGGGDQSTEAESVPQVKGFTDSPLLGSESLVFTFFLYVLLRKRKIRAPLSERCLQQCHIYLNHLLSPA